MSRAPEIEQLLARISELESIVENSPDVISRFDRQLRHVYVNRAVEAASGLTVADFRGKTHAELGMPDELVEPWRQVYREVFETGVEGRKEFTFPGPDGPRSYVSRVVPERGPDGTVETVLSVARDVTEWKRAEEARLTIERRLQEANKLESLGLLAGGVAHDFNNLLTGVLAGASLLATRTTSPEATRAVAERIEQSALRAADLCRQLLAYAGRAQVSRCEVDLGELCESTVSLIGTSIARNVRLEIRREDPGHVLVGDPVQIQQVVMNLALNAAEAIGERPGTVRVSTRLVYPSAFPQHPPVVGPERPEGPHLQLRVEDDGRGMDEGTLARVFEPFFTTHFHGRGLGLAAVLGTVRAHGGTLYVASAPGRGTAFDLYFPATPGRRVSSPVVATPAPRSLEGACILVVDDEPDVLDATSLLLRELGVEPRVARGGRAAIEQLRDGLVADAVLLDLTMPDLDGVETLSSIRGEQPSLPVVLMSGFAEDEALAAAGSQRVAGFLHKPFGLEQLVSALRGVVGPRR